MKTKIILIIAIIISGYAIDAAFFRSKLVNYGTESLANLYSPDIPNYYDALKNLDFNKFWLTFQNNGFPPFYEISAAISLLIVGINWTFMTILNNSLFLLVLLVFTFLTGCQIKDELTGVISLLLVAAHPFTIGLFRSYSLDFAVMSVTVMSVYFLIKSEFFKNMNKSIYFALSCALGMLVKESFAAFILGPIMIAFFSVCKETFNKNYKPLKNFVIFCFLFILLIAPYYFYLCGLTNMLGRFKGPGETAVLAWYKWENLRLVFIGKFESLLGVPFYFAVVVGVYYFIVGKKSFKEYTLLSVIIVSDILLIFMPHCKSIRYLLPQLPVLLLICALGIRNLMDNCTGKLLLLMTISAAVFTYLVFTYDISGGKIRNIGDWLKKGYGRYYCGDIIQPLSEARQSSEKLAAIFLNNSFSEKVKNIKAMHVISYPPNLLVLNKTDDIIVEFCIYSFFWFNNIPVNQIFFPLNYVGDTKIVSANRDGFEVIYTNRNKIDLMLTGVPAGSKAGSFDVINKYLKLESRNSYNEYEKMWSVLLKNFKKCELLYEDSGFAFYLYSK